MEDDTIKELLQKERDKCFNAMYMAFKECFVMQTDDITLDLISIVMKKIEENYEAASKVPM